MTSLHTVARRPFPAARAAGPLARARPGVPTRGANRAPGGAELATALASGRLVHTEADLRAPAARAALDGVEVLYHLGFQLWRGHGGRAGMQAANLEGTDNVLAARPRRVVLASSAAVYGARPDNPLPLSEDHPPRPNPECPYALDKLAVEQRCSAAAPTAVLRIAGVLGAAMDRRVARAVAGYRVAVPAVAGHAQAVQFVDEHDAVLALVAAGRRGAAGCYNVASEDWLDAPAIASVAGSRVMTLPRRVLLGGAEAGRRSRLFPFGADRAVLVDGPLALDVGRAARHLRWRPRYTSRQVLAAALGGRGVAS